MFIKNVILYGKNYMKTFVNFKEKCMNCCSKCNFNKHDKGLAIDYSIFPNTVSNICYAVFGMEEIDDNWLLDISYREKARLENNCYE